VSPRLYFHESAELELNEAADFYDLGSPGLGSDFFDEVERGLGHVAGHPEAPPRPSLGSAQPGRSILVESLPGDQMSVHFRIEVDQEADGRWIAEVIELPGVLAYGSSKDEAIAHVQALALRVVADRLEHDEAGRELLDISFKAA
jgi:predicted RNase H-like HicB family nuclease